MSDDKTPPVTIEVNPAVLAQNVANEAAGLPPISHDGITPAVVPEETLSPIYPKMTALVDAVTTDTPIPVSPVVSAIEKPNTTPSAEMRTILDAFQQPETDETTETPVETETDATFAAVGVMSGGNLSFDGGIVTVGSVTMDQIKSLRRVVTIQSVVIVLLAAFEAFHILS